ncbi:hypothetical protein [uncultured Anaerovibrio sp.]|uniref:hypothetical protein n=1 Tax=uncultured Anaerovibrio sp. TaxID=361586 RepID=UPI00260A7E78|nr:hypothetical protein [uncultured Anaerovibrio sp.]
MSSYYSCMAFDDIKTLIRIDDCLYLFMKTKNSEFEVTLNPAQGRLLGEALMNAVGKISIDNIRDVEFYGDMQIEHELAENEGGNEYESDRKNNLGNPFDGNSRDTEKEKVKIA